MFKDYVTVFLILFIIGNNTRFFLVIIFNINILYICVYLNV